MSWHFDNDMPIYIQIVHQVKQRIVSGVYPLGSQLPPVRELADEISVNPNTVQKAMMNLEAEGLVYSKGTVGRFITEDTKMINEIKCEMAYEEVQKFLMSMKTIGVTKDEVVKMIESAEREMK